jgi:DNA integrity scanning protein DisA with diadenylate cyclase activity
METIDFEAMGARRPSTDAMDQAFRPICERVHCSDAKRAVLEELIELAVELAREGREGRKVGTLFVFGDHDSVLERSRPLLLDPLHGHPAELRHIGRADLRETIKELAQLDGAFVVQEDGTFVAAARYIDVELKGDFSLGLGTRHAAGSSITSVTKSVSVVVSQSSVVRVYAKGELMAEIIPELYLMSRDRLFTQRPQVRELPELGLSIAVSGDEATELAV